MQALDQILSEAESAINAATDLKTLDDCRVHFLGKKGQLTEYLKTLGSLPADERPAAGQKVNTLKETIRVLIEQKAETLRQAAITQQLQREALDITLPGKRQAIGSLHPISQTFVELKRIFTQMGFCVLEGPEIEDEFYNFSALNIPDLHPARAMMDTFYFANGQLLRTHMSPVEVRAMQSLPLPLRMVALGKVYRRDFDLTHTPMFHQMECQIIDEHISFADLKGLLSDFIEAFFGRKIALRFRPSYFPFTEPSAEVDIACVNCQGQGCRICKQTGWLEVLGCGMLHPNVLHASGIDSERYRGIAFGVGIDRLTMLKHGITDLRALFENDIRFLKQF